MKTKTTERIGKMSNNVALHLPSNGEDEIAEVTDTVGVVDDRADAWRGRSTSAQFAPLHLHPGYQRALGCWAGTVPVPEEVVASAVRPIYYPDMTDSDVANVPDPVRDTLAACW